MFPLLVALAHADEGVPPLMILHLDPAASVVEDRWSGELGARVEFPLLLGAATIALGMMRVISGDFGAVDDILTPLPPLSAMYTGYVSRSFDDPARWDGGGGMALRYRPLATTRLPAAGRGLWIDLGGRYGTRGWGMDGGVGWDLQLTRGLAIGPAGTFAWEGGQVRWLAALSFSFSLDVESLGREVEVGPEAEALPEPPPSEHAR